MFELLNLVLVISVAAVVYAVWLAKDVLSQSKGTKEMQHIAHAIEKGANAFLKRQYSTIALITVVIAVIIYAGYTLLGKPNDAMLTSLAFIFGAFCSGLAGYIGMWIAVRTNLRTAANAEKGINAALTTALKGGAVSGFMIVALSLLGITLLFYLLEGSIPIQEIPLKIVGFGFGASLVALFAQLGGGIYTKAADVGADLVGKLEAGIPEDDPRNPAVIADLVGDNVGDCAGRGADLFESTAAENIGAMILGVALFPVFGIAGVLFPLVVRAFGLVASMIGISSVKVRGDEAPMKALSRGFWVTAIVAAILFYAAVYLFLQGNLFFFAAGVVGILTSVAMLYATTYYTESEYRPVKDIAQASETGPATNVIAGLAVGFETTASAAIILAVALLSSYWLGNQSGFNQGGLFGTAMATMGMLATAAYVLAMDTFGPISDNAGGIVEMSKADEKIRKVTDKLDAAGNTTKALTKGYAIGSAGLAAFLLFGAYMVDTKLTSIDISKVEVFVGALLGAMLVYLFTALTLQSVGKTAQVIVKEVRRQFKEIKGIMKGTHEPDYAKCVDISTQAALKEMVAPSLLVVVMTVVVGVVLKAEAAGAFIMVTTISGIMLALTLNNAGGAWDNAKKFIETGAHGGKGSFAHKAAVCGDTVGDPCKDTSGPSLHVVIKLVGTLSLVLAPLFFL